MGIWPFRRKSNRRKSTGGAENSQSTEMHHAVARQDPAKHDGSELVPAGPERRKSRRDTKRKSSRDSKRLQRDPEKARRTYSFSPGRHDSIRVRRDENQPPVPPIPSHIKGEARAKTDGPEAVLPGSRPRKANTQVGDTVEDWQRMPTLRKRSPESLARRKSSKKRKEEHDREKEIKAMVATMPILAEAPGKPTRTKSKKVNAVSNRRPGQPSSDVSLPVALSLRSSVSSHSDYQSTAYKLSSIGILSPRPTIKYAENPRYGPHVQLNGSEGSDSRKRVSERVTLDEETLKAHKRIDDLADDLDAHELRELMERDQKRREKKKITEMMKMERRLAKRQEKQRADEAAAFRNGTPPPPNMERGVLGRDIVGLGIGTSAIVTSSKRKGSDASDNGRGKRPADSFRPEASGSAPSPLSEFRRHSFDDASPTSEVSEHIIETAQVGKVSKATVSPPQSPRGHMRGASSLSQMMDLAQPQPATAPIPISQPSRNVTEPVRQPGSWISFFKLRSRNRRSATPSSFSNDSRDVMARDQIPQLGSQPMRSANIPKRTMSKFREDLPELPISPPDSRVQSPEADDVPPIRTDFPGKGKGAEDSRVRYDTPTSGYRSLDTMRMQDETPTSSQRTVEDPSPEPVGVLSQSLASIDSEGSWLSGRRITSKRAPSQQGMQRATESSSSLNNRYEDFSESAEELGIAEDGYFSRISPEPLEQNRNRKSTGMAMPSSDEEDLEDTKWGSVSRRPTVVHRQPQAKSTEGLLNQFDADSEEGETPTSINRSSFMEPKGSPESGDSPVPGVLRARSVDLGKGHVRHISAGSARLLDVKPRMSGEGKRLSSGSTRDFSAASTSTAGRELTPGFL